MNLKHRVRMTALALAAALTLSLSIPAAAASNGAGQGQTAPVAMISQAGGGHVKYMEGSNGLFNPDKNVTRAELAQMLSRIVKDTPSAAPSFSDVKAGAWYAPAVKKIAGFGMMSGADGVFRPNAPATRAECAAALALLIPYSANTYSTFPDVPEDHWACGAIARTAGYGLFKGDDTGTFRPDSPLKRCEAVAVFNRLLGRTPSLETVNEAGMFNFYPDVPKTHWAYAEIAEASITHGSTTASGGAERWTWADADWVEDGPRRIDGRLYWLKGGKFVRSQSVGNLYFDAEGRYTTKNADLDSRLNAIVEAQTNDSMTRDQKLRALYDYVVKNYTYLTRPIVAKGTQGWEPDYAQFFLEKGKGNCFSFAAAYCLLCRELGLQAYTIVGASGSANSPHGWVEIPLDGHTYMFDPELQWYYNNRTKKTYNLFKMLSTEIPSGVYRYIW